QDVVAVNESVLAKSIPKRCACQRCQYRGIIGQKADPVNLPCLLRPCRRKPRGRRAAEQRNEVATPHSITPSARTKNVSEIVRPSVLAVLRLTISSNFVGCSIGRSAGLAPLRIRSTKYAARRYRARMFMP